MLEFLAKLFGVDGKGNLVKETVEVFRPNAEAGEQRDADLQAAVYQQFASEFNGQTKGGFDRFVDALNRLPRPLMVLSVFGVLIYTPMNPVHMAEVFAAWALIPAGLWAIMGVIVRFYFYGREQIKAQDFQRDIAEAVSRAPSVIENIRQIRELRHDSPGVADTGTDAELSVDAVEPSENPAVRAWQEAGDAKA